MGVSNSGWARTRTGRDDQRFLVNTLLDAAASPINVGVNWHLQPAKLDENGCVSS